MPLTRIEIEQTSHDNWHAEIEVGGMVARREAINARSFDEVMIHIEDIYRKFMPSAPPLRAPVIAAQSTERAQDEIASAIAQSPRPVAPSSPLSEDYPPQDRHHPAASGAQTVRQPAPSAPRGRPPLNR